MSSGTALARALPRFADLPPEARTPEAVRRAFRSPPTVRIALADLERERREIRGVYDCSWPDVAPEIAFGYGRSCTQWLNREPDWRKARRPLPAFYLFEVTPVLDGGAYLNYRWCVEVAGEAEGMEAAAVSAALTRAATRRAD